MNPAPTSRKIAPHNVTVLVEGESGTGKELFARAIHAESRRGGPFGEVNCGARPEGLVESLLFGHARGAFSGAVRPHAGHFEAAGGGTLFLDEIGEPFDLLGNGLELPALVADLARHYLARALDEANGNKTRAAELIGLPSYQTLTNWMKRYDVTLPDRARRR